jgi:hypothetical protein
MPLTLQFNGNQAVEMKNLPRAYRSGQVILPVSRSPFGFDGVELRPAGEISELQTFG